MRPDSNSAWRKNSAAGQEPQYTFWILIFTAQFITFYTVIELSRSLSRYPSYTGRDAIGDTFLIAATTIIIGFTFGVWVRDTEGFRQDVTIKGERIEDAGVIIVTPHHTALYVHDLAVVVPTADISRMEARKTLPRTTYFKLRQETEQKKQAEQRSSEEERQKDLKQQ